MQRYTGVGLFCFEINHNDDKSHPPHVNDSKRIDGNNRQRHHFHHHNLQIHHCHHRRHHQYHHHYDHDQDGDGGYGNNERGHGAWTGASAGTSVAPGRSS